jgi:STAS domain-containing protein
MERTSPGVLRVSLSGNWRVPSVGLLSQSLSENTTDRCVEFDVTALTGWDSRFVAFVNRCAALCRDRRMNFRSDGLPEGVRRLLRLANAVPEKKDRPLKSGLAQLSRTGASPRGKPEVIATTLSDLAADFSRDLAQSIRDAVP